MKLSKFAAASVALVASAAMVFGSVSAANAAYPPNAKITVSGVSKGTASKTYTYKVKTPTSGKVSGEKVVADLNGKTFTATLNSNGDANVKVKFPSKAGRYTLVFSAYGTSAGKIVTVGKAAYISSLKAKSITKKSTKSTTVTGKTAKKGSVTLKFTAPDGSGIKSFSKTVKANSKGKFSYKYSKATKVGTYTVTATFVTSSKYFGSSSKTVTFKKTK